MHLLNKTNFYKIIVLVFCVSSLLHTKNPIVPLKILKIKESNNVYFYATNEQKNNIGLYKIDINNTWEHLWEYNFDSNKSINYIDCQIGDITGDGRQNLIIVLYSYEEKQQIYLFNLDQNIPAPSPEIYSITSLHNSSEPIQTQLISSDKDKDLEIIISFTSPERKILVFDYAINELINTDQVATDFLTNTWGNIFFTARDIDNDGLEDIVVYTNDNFNKRQINYSNKTIDLIELPNTSSIKSVNNMDFIIYDDSKVSIDNNQKTSSELIANIYQKGDSQFVLELNNKELVQANLKELINKDNIEKNVFFQTEKHEINNQYILINKDVVLLSSMDQRELKLLNIGSFNEQAISKGENQQPVIEKEQVINGKTTSEVISERAESGNQETAPPPKQNEKEEIKKLLVININQEAVIDIPIDKNKNFFNLNTVNQPEGLTVNPKTMQFLWTPTEDHLGYHNLEFNIIYQDQANVTATQEDNKIAITNTYDTSLVNIHYPIYVNDIPKLLIDNFQDTIYSNQTMMIDYIIEDLNDDQVPHIMIENNETLRASILDSSILWQATNEYAGSNNWNIIVSDSISTDTTKINFFVDTLQRTPEHIETFVVTVDEEWIYQMPPKEQYIIKEAPINLRITKKGQIHWVPLISQIDWNDIIIETTANNQIEIMRYQVYVNFPPIISYRPAQQEIIMEGENFVFKCKSFDMNASDSLFWEIDTLNMQGGIISETGEILWSSTNFSDNIEYKIILSDSTNTDIMSGTIYVNSYPEITSNPPEYIQLGDTLIYHVVANDKNKEAPFQNQKPNILYYNILNAPENFSINDTGLVYFIPNENNLGENFINIAISDSIVNTSHSFNLVVNDAPSITSVDSVSIELGDTLKHIFNVKDLNSDGALSYNIKTSIEEILFNTKRGQLTWVPKKEDLGLHALEISVSDQFSQNGDMQKLKIFVYEKPKLINMPIPEAYVNMQYMFYPKAADMYGDTILNEDVFIKQVELDSMPLFAYDDLDNYFSWLPTIDDLGKKKVRFNIADKFNSKNEYSFDLNVLLSPCETADTLFYEISTMTQIEPKSDTIYITKIDTIKIIKTDSIYISSPSKTEPKPPLQELFKINTPF